VTNRARRTPRASRRASADAANARDAADRHVARSRRVGIALAANLLVVGAETSGALASHSVALLADAGHDLADVAGLALSFVAVRLVRRSPTDQRSYGYHRTTIVSALANVVLALGIAIVVVVLAVARLGRPGHLDGGIVVIVAGFAAVANAIGALVLADGSHDLNLRAGVLHLASDAITSVAVVVVGVVVLTTGRLTVLDPVLSVAIALLVAARGWTVARESLDILLEASPGDVDVDQLRAAMTDVPGVTEVHDLHCWSLSSEVRALSAHVVLDGHPSLEQANAIGETVKSRIGRPFGILHTTLELECERCTEADAQTCPIDGRAVTSTALGTTASDHGRATAC